MVMLVQITASPVAVAATSRAQPGADSAPAAGAPRDQAQTSAATGGALTSTPVGSAPGDAPASLTRTNQPGEAAQAHEEAVFGQSTHDRLALVLQQQEIRQLKQRDQEVR
ncbi:MAG: hypothetical protein KDI36_11965, partial [Pseudomonadales bacterium]|nr:hypothetical protein [Pseudomonadales bacterium]